LIQRITEHLILIDPEPQGYKRVLATYMVLANDKVMIIDPGPNVCIDNLINEMLKYGIKVANIKYIALTHIHIDHGGGTGLLIKQLNIKPKIIVHPRGVKHVINPEKLWKASLSVLKDVAILMGKPEPLPSELVHGVNDGETIDLGDVRVKVIYTPGHAPHHVCYFIEPDNVVVTGDAVGLYFDGRLIPVSVPIFDANEARNSLKKLINLKPSIVTVSHFGSCSENGEEVLIRALNKIDEWEKKIEDILKRGMRNVNEVYKELINIDEDLRYISKIRNSTPLSKNSGFNCVLGMIYYVAKKLGMELK